MTHILDNFFITLGFDRDEIHQIEQRRILYFGMTFALMTALIFTGLILA